MNAKSPKITVARIYDVKIVSGEDSGGAVRILVDRLWPRGVNREEAGIDFWPKDLTPSTELRKSWHDDPHGHDSDHFKKFEAAYRKELKSKEAQEALDELVKDIGNASEILLLTATQTPDVSHVTVIRETIKNALAK